MIYCKVINGLCENLTNFFFPKLNIILGYYICHDWIRKIMKVMNFRIPIDKPIFLKAGRPKGKGMIYLSSEEDSKNITGLLIFCHMK